jgi:hypothetical protein
MNEYRRAGVVPVISDVLAECFRIRDRLREEIWILQVVENHQTVHISILTESNQKLKCDCINAEDDTPILRFFRDCFSPNLE